MANHDTQASAVRWRLRLRPELQVQARATAGLAGYLIEDPATGIFHRLGLREYRLAAALDGQRSLEEAAASAAADAAAFTRGELETLARWLVHNRLAELVDDGGQTAPVATARPTARWNFDPFFLRIPLLRPSGLFAAIAPLCGWLFASPVVYLAGVATIWAVTLIGMQQERFFHSWEGIVLPQTHAILFACWLGLKIVHEIAHGVAAHRYGVAAREAGVSFFFGVPAPYVDVTSAWRLDSRWQRIVISAAGMYAETWCALIAAAVWLLVEDPAVRQACAYLITVAAADTFLFNANPLMRFDGYYMLSDAWDQPNLYGRSQRPWQQGLERWLWGTIDTDSKPVSLALAAYGLAAIVWRWLSLSALALAAVTFYGEWGVFFVLLAMALWFGRGLWRSWEGLAKVSREQPRTLLRPAMIVITTLAGAIALGVFIPWPFAPSAAGVVRHADEIMVRAGSAGIVSELVVCDGALVQAGEVLVVQANDQLQIEQRELQTALAKTELLIRQRRQEKKWVEMQVEEERLIPLRQQLLEKDAQVAALVTRAPVRGRVFARQWHELRGRFVSAGEELCVLGDEGRKEVRVAIPDGTFPHLTARLPQPVRVSLPNGDLAGELIFVEPQASRAPPDPSLVVTQGGPLAVERRQREQEETWELVEPHVVGKVRLTGDHAATVYSGQRCAVCWTTSRKSIGEHLVSRWQQWLTQRPQTR